MYAPRRLLAVLLFAAVGLLALAFSGLLDWITSLLFLALEFLAEFLRPLVTQRKGSRTHAPGRGRQPPGSSGRGGERHRRPLAHRKSPAGRPRPRAGSLAAPEPLTLTAPPPPTPRLRMLVPVCEDRPELFAFALDECRGRQAELLLLFLRPLAVLPMGPNPLPGLAEDDRARTLFARLGEEAGRAGVPLRTLYQVTRDTAATILEMARAHQADVLLMEPSRRNLLARALVRDEVQAVVMHLPEHVSLLIHAGS